MLTVVRPTRKTKIRDYLSVFKALTVLRRGIQMARISQRMRTYKYYTTSTTTQYRSAVLQSVASYWETKQERCCERLNPDLNGW